MGKKNIFFVCMMIPFFLFGQKKKKDQYVFSSIPSVNVDADLSDWNGNLYNTESALWSFGLTISDNKLYAAVLIKDKDLLSEVVRNGILLNISYSDKKKEGAQLLFPRFNSENLEKSLNGEETDRPFSNEELIKSSKGYYVKGFSKVVDGLLSFQNSYGIEASCVIDSLGNMNYEAVVPLSLINFKSNEIAVEISAVTQYSIMKKSSSSNVRRDIYGRSMTRPTVKNPYSEETSVWFTGILK